MTRTLIVGAGIGGLATATALGRGGAELVVFERAPELSKVEVGAGITLWCNAMVVLDRLGVGQEVRRRGAVLNVFEQRDHRGRLLSRWPLDKMARRLGAPVCGINRPDLHAALAEAGGGWVQTGATAQRFDERDGQVTVTFADGRAETGDVLIGADGLESVIRSQLLGAAPLRYSGLTIWRANLPLDRGVAPPVDFIAWWGAGAKFVIFRSGPERVSWEAIVTSAAGEQDPPGQKRQAIGRRFANFVDLVHRTIDATDEDAIVRTDVCDRRPSKRWGDGRVTLLGDAAHPMTFAVGQGAAQALEDALEITAAISDANGNDDLPAVLRAYEQRRIPRTAHFQNLAWRLARAGALTSPPAQLARNVGFMLTSPIGWRVQVKDMTMPGEPREHQRVA
jgi:2-polyprenyl-6-methoxyphenol hydroxylase-like FAD-dependent oxidoreductase